MPKRVSHLTRIIDVKEVEFQGKLTFNHVIDAWYVDKDDIEEWFDKLISKRVRLVLTNLEHCDDSPMLNRGATKEHK